MDTSKECNRCHETKPVDEFYPLKGIYLSAYCKPCVKLNSKEWVEKNPDKVRGVQKAHRQRERGTVWGRAGQIREGMVSRSRKRGWPTPEFTRQEIAAIIDGGRCAKTGIPFEFHPGDGKRSPWVPVPDRIDTSKPYTKENVQWVCNMYNTAKSDWTDEDVEKMVRSFHNNRLRTAHF